MQISCVRIALGYVAKVSKLLSQKVPQGSEILIFSESLHHLESEYLAATAQLKSR